jgi:hypothetical protein
VLVVARRMRDVVERIDLFLPRSDLFGLPQPGTPVPEFSAVAVDGTPISHLDLAGTERFMALLTTDCASCHDQVAALRDLGSTQEASPLVVVIGTPGERAPMVTALAEHAVVIEEAERGPIAEALEVHDFPAVLLVRQGHVQAAGHGVASVLASAGSPAQR